MIRNGKLIMLECLGSVSKREKMDALVWERYAVFDRALQYVNYLYLGHVK